MTFSEDDDRFRTFFETRYLSLTVHMKVELRSIVNETMRWLDDEVFVQQENAEKTEFDKEQAVFEASMAKDIREARNVLNSRCLIAIQEVRGGVEVDEGE